MKPEGNVNSEAPISRLFLCVILHMPQQLNSAGQGFLSERLLPEVRFFRFNQLVVTTIIGSFNYQLICYFSTWEKTEENKVCHLDVTKKEVVLSKKQQAEQDI